METVLAFPTEKIKPGQSVINILNGKSRKARHFFSNVIANINNFISGTTAPSP